MGKVVIPASVVAALREHKAHQPVDVKENKEIIVFKTKQNSELL